MAKLKKLVKDYRDYHQHDADKRLTSYRKLNEQYSQLVDCSIRGVLPDGTKAPRQRKFAKYALKTVSRNLMDAEHKIKDCSSFDEVLLVVYNCKVKGFPAPSVYDTALRLGSCFNLWPDIVHLHANALTGAKTLLGSNIKWQYFNDDKNYPYLAKTDFPVELQVLEPYHIENFLNIYNDRLRGLG